MATYYGNRTKLTNSAKAATATTLPAIGSTGCGPPDGPIAVPTYIADMQAIGATIGRTFLAANFINPSAGVYNFAYRQGGPDLWVADALAANQTLILQDVFNPNFWFQGSPTHSAQPYLDSPLYSATPGSDWDYFMTNRTTWLTKAAQQYPDSRIIWEMGNEMNVPGIYWHYNYSSALAPTPQAYADYFMRGAAAIKAVNPAQKVIIGGLLRVDSDPFSGLPGITFMQQLQPFFAAASFIPDGVSLHPYMLGAATSNPTIDKGPNGLGVTSWQCVGRFLNTLDALGYHIPVYITETGFRASRANAQNAFNCNSEATKALWNRYEHDAVFYQYSKPARGNGSKSWVEAMMYYRHQEYPSPTASSYSGAYPGDPASGPHPLNAWGLSLQDYITRQTNRQPIPKLESVTLTGVPSTAVIGQAAVTISAAGGNIGAVPQFSSSDATVSTVTPPTVGTATTTISFPGAGTVTIKAQSLSAAGLPVSTAQTIVVASQIPTASIVSPDNGWQVATSNSGTIQFTVVVTDQIGNPIVSPAGAWDSSDATNFPVDPVTGLGTAIGVATGVVVRFTPTGFSNSGPPAGTSTGNVVLNPVLQITNAPTQLINVGATPIIVTDGAVTVTGVTLVISDATKATATGQDLYGKGTSGTFTLTAQKATYSNSSPVTITCTGDASGASTYSYLDDKDAIGLSNGAAVTTYTDVGGNTWAQATGSKQPTYTTAAINSHAAITFDGVDDVLKATATAVVLNNTAFTYAALLKPTNASAAANEQLLDNRNTTSGQQGGFVLGRNVTTLVSDLSYYVPGPTLQQQFDGAAMATNAWTVLIDRVSQGNQNRMLNGVGVGIARTDATYLNPTTNPPFPTKGGNISTNAGNNFKGPVALEGLVNRYVTDAERLQIHYRLQLYQGTGINPGTLDHLDLLISSTAATVGGTTPTLTVQKWADAGETTPSTATVTLSYTSATPATATVNSSTGVITLVAAGTTTFTVTDSISGKTATTPTLTVSSGGTVTSVVISYNGQVAPILARTGSTYTLVAKDQSGNTLSGGTWSSSDATNAPVNSSGIASPAAGSAGTGVTWTYLDVGAVYSGTLSATVLLGATDLLGDTAPNYANDAALLAQIANSVPVNSSFNSNVPTNTTTAKYYDGNYCNQIQIDATRLFMGVKTFRVTITANIGPTLRALLNSGTGYSRLFCYTVNRFEPGFTMVGTGGGASAYKITPWFTWPPDSGRCGPEGTNGNNSGGTGGAPGGTFDLGCGGPNGGQSTQTTYAIQGEMSATTPQYYLDVVMYETISGNIISSRHFHCSIGSAVGTALDAGGSLPYGLVEGPMNVGFSPFLASVVAPFGENYNQTAITNIWRNVGFWGVVDGTSVGDPLGIFGTQATPTLTSIIGGTMTHGTTTNTVSFTGTNFTENCHPLFSNPGVLVQSRTLNSSTSLSCVVNVTAGASLGASTVLIKNNASMVSTATQPILIL